MFHIITNSSTTWLSVKQEIVQRKERIKKKVVDPFTRKDWFDIKAPTTFENRNVGKTLINRSTGLKNAADGLKGRVFEVCLADLQGSEDHSYRKIKLRVDEVQGKTC